MDTLNQANNGYNEPAKKPRYIHWSIVIAIIIVTNLFFNYVISLLYIEPSYDKFCPAEIYNKAYDNKGQCLENGGMWSEQVTPVENIGQKKATTQVSGYCNATYTCQKKFNLAQNLYNRNVFIILVALGVLVMIAGAYVGIALLSLAFAWSGVLSLFIASVRYWGSADSLIRVLILGAALAALIWLAVKKFNK